MKLSEAFTIIRHILTDEQLEILFGQLEEGIKWDRCWEDVLIETINDIMEDK